MTVTLPAKSRMEHLTAHLADLRDDRKTAVAEVAPVFSGDDADRATNVDANIRLTILDQRIADVEFEINEAERPDLRPRATGQVGVGTLVTVDFGDGVETYVFDSIEHFDDAIAVITPTSPLGIVLDGSRVGDTVDYRTRDRRPHSATVVAVQ